MYTPKIISTEDGSKTISLEEMDETYHSTHGALTEAKHVYIMNGLTQCSKENINVLEIGFGTGLNALATLDTLIKTPELNSVKYTTLEKFPLPMEVISELNYGDLTEPNLNTEYTAIHEATWEEANNITPQFIITKLKFDLLTDQLTGTYDVVYYDAFAPSKQEEMWTEEVLKKVIDCMAEGAILATYCAKGVVRRLLNHLGLTTQRVPGPPGKREMIIATKKTEK